MKRIFDTAAGDDLRTSYHVYQVEDETLEDIVAFVAENHPATHCTHSYDCCGHWYANAPTWAHLNHGAEIVVRQDWILNI